MDWREVTIYTTTEGIGPVEALLEDNGVEGYVLEDAADFEEFLKDTEIYWDYVDEDLVREKRAQETCLKIYLPDSDEGAKQYADIRAALENLKARDEEHAWGRLCTETALTRQEDWEWGWKQYFKPFPVGKGFMIKPSWETVEDPQGRRILEIDPASSFGTGSHDTTQLCMMALEDAVKPGDKLLDMGTGSGILAIAAAMLGADVQTIVDIDENCLKTAHENAEKNHVEIGRGLCGDALRDPKLAEDIGGRLTTIETLTGKVEERSPETVREYREKLTARMQEVLQSTTIDESRILTEAAIYADKVAVDEETVRLRSHVSQLRDMLLSDEPMGRKMDFLIQEVNRESNTIGSKCNDITIARDVVALKAEVEKIREQVQNIE